MNLLNLVPSRATPPQLFVGSFAAMILLGTLGLKLLPGIYRDQPLSWLDALFIATSAVCVTGLIVVDTPTHFTFLGQLFLLILIQIGGLGMLTFTSLIILALGKRLSLRAETLAGGAVGVVSEVRPTRLLRDIVLFTFGIELLGAILLYALWVPQFGLTGAVWPAVFHSVSAFCNAGFSTFSDSLVSQHDRPLVLAVVMALVIVGGIGFLTLEEVARFLRERRRSTRFRLSLHSRLVLITTLVLTLLGWVVFLGLDYDAALASMDGVDAAVNALFMSVTARTAGFNTIDYAAASVGSNFFTIVLMSIGGSPGSTAGGMKTTTVALLALLAWSRFRGRGVTSVAGRSVNAETTQRASSVFLLAIVLSTVGILLISTIETETGHHPDFLRYMFEAVSAFNTVGLSMGATPGLEPSSRVVVIVLMFVGRVGPLVMAAALVARGGSGSRFRYAYENVVVG